MIGVNRPYLIAVSLLTSMSAPGLQQLGIEQEPQAYVERLAQLAINSGLDGLVCSAREAKGLRAKFGDAPLLVTPGINIGHLEVIVLSLVNQGKQLSND